MILRRWAAGIACVCAFIVGAPHAARAQSPAEESMQPAQTTEAPLTADHYTPVDTPQRIHWIVDGVVGTQSLFVVGPLSTIWQTAWNTPPEWGQTWSGAAKRYAQREADVAISNTIEGGLGAIWGEEPRYIPSGRKGIWPRARYAIMTAFVTQGHDGRLHPAWARYAGNTLNNVIENAWLPPSQTTAWQTAGRSALGMVTRVGGNAWDEFWPDVRRLLRKH
jgi:hypothetical protein